MKKRLKFELMHLMKEYFAEGLLRSARDGFGNYFFERSGLRRVIKDI